MIIRYQRSLVMKNLNSMSKEELIYTFTEKMTHTIRSELKTCNSLVIDF